MSVNNFYHYHERKCKDVLKYYFTILLMTHSGSSLCSLIVTGNGSLYFGISSVEEDVKIIRFSLS